MPPVRTLTPLSDDIGAGQTLGEDLGAGQGALLAVLELLGAGDLEGDGLGGDGVHQRPALLAGEDGGVELLGPLLLGQDQAGARPAERLVDGARTRRRRTGTGDGCSPAATRPAKCAMSTHRYAPTSSAIDTERGEVLRDAGTRTSRRR